MKCDSCKFNKHYLTGADEYPAGVHSAYCSKGHWSGYEDIEPPPNTEDLFADCVDYQITKAPE